MIYKQDLSLFSEEELLNLRTAITERLESYKGNALDRESFEAQLGALKVMVEASDPNELGGVNKRSCSTTSSPRLSRVSLMRMTTTKTSRVFTTRFKLCFRGGSKLSTKLSAVESGFVFGSL